VSTGVHAIFLFVCPNAPCSPVTTSQLSIIIAMDPTISFRFLRSAFQDSTNADDDLQTRYRMATATPAIPLEYATKHRAKALGTWSDLSPTLHRGRTSRRREALQATNVIPLASTVASALPAPDNNEADLTRGDEKSIERKAAMRSRLTQGNLQARILHEAQRRKEQARLAAIAFQNACGVNLTEPPSLLTQEPPSNPPPLPTKNQERFKAPRTRAKDADKKRQKKAMAMMKDLLFAVSVRQSLSSMVDARVAWWTLAKSGLEDADPTKMEIMMQDSMLLDLVTQNLRTQGLQDWTPDPAPLGFDNPLLSLSAPPTSPSSAPEPPVTPPKYTPTQLVAQTIFRYRSQPKRDAKASRRRKVKTGLKSPLRDEVLPVGTPWPVSVYA
jgi:hypothetical protein